MTYYAIRSDTRFIVEADTPEQAMAWLNEEVELPDVVNVGHVQCVVELDDEQIATADGATQDAWHAANGVLVLLWHYSPAAWPDRAFPPDEPGSDAPDNDHVTRLFPASTTEQPKKGGYRPIARLIGWLEELKIEALVARQSSSPQRRNHAFEDIAQLAQQCAEFVQQHAKPAAAGAREGSHAA